MTGRFDGLSDEELAARSIRELNRGRLPARTQRRLAAMRAGQAFTSDLTVDEHHAVRSVGFSPVGQVFGSCVHSTGWPGVWTCEYIDARNDFTRSYEVARVVAADERSRPLLEARELAARRMRQECRRLRGDGVVGVRLWIRPFPGGGVEFQTIGTAVRADGDVRPRNTFLSALSGQEFAMLLTAGWVPTGLAMGLAVMARHDKDYLTERQRRSWRNQELVGRTELLQAARREARVRLREDCARFGGAGVVVRTMTVRTETVPCRNRARGPDRLVEALIIGTAITPFGRAGGSAPPAPLPVVRLSNPLRGKEHEW